MNIVEQAQEEYDRGKKRHRNRGADDSAIGDGATTENRLSAETTVATRLRRPDDGPNVPESRQHNVGMEIYQGRDATG
jgi:hypothetical protein